MKNELLTIGPVTIYGYGLMIAIGVLAAYFSAEFRAKRKSLNPEIIFNLTIWCLIGGILGAKLLYYIVEIKNIIANPKLLLDVSNGFAVFGGIIGGILAGYLFCKKNKLNFLKYFDLVMPSIALAQGFGRLGCLLAGCCFGKETSGAFHIVFENSKYAPNDIHLVPTQPLSSALNFVNFFALVFLSKKTKADGQIAGFYLIFYSAGRFILEFFRGDLERGSIGTISTSQFIAIFTFVIGIGIVLVTGFMSRKSSLTEQAYAEAEEYEFDDTDIETLDTDEEDTENEVIEREVTENEVTENEVTEREVTEREVTEREVTEREVTDEQPSRE